MSSDDIASQSSQRLGWKWPLFLVLAIVGLVFAILSPAKMLSTDAGSLPAIEVLINKRLVGVEPMEWRHSVPVKLGVKVIKGKLTLQEFREQLKEERLRINLEMAARTSNIRGLWLGYLKYTLTVLALLCSLLAFGPLWLWYRQRHSEGAGWLALRYVPHYILAAALTILMMNGTQEIVLGLQKIQVFLSSFGAPHVAASDAVVGYLIHANDQELMLFLKQLTTALQHWAKSNLTDASLLQPLWSSLQSARDSTAFDIAQQIMSMAHWASALYAPFLGGLTVVLLYQVMWPLVQLSLGFPQRAIDENIRVRSFVWDMVKRFWEEVRAMFWMLLLVFVLTAGMVVATRLLAYLWTGVSIKTFLSVFHVSQTTSFPHMATFANFVVMGLCLVALSGILLGSAGMVVGKAYPMIRCRIKEKRKFRSFPHFFRGLKLMVLRVVLPTLLASLLPLGMYHGLLPYAGQGVARIWLPVPLLGIVMSLLLWRLQVIPHLMELYHIDPLAAESEAFPRQ